MPKRHTQLVDLRDRCQDQLGFHEGEVIANAEMWAAIRLPHANDHSQALSDSLLVLYKSQ